MVDLVFALARSSAFLQLCQFQYCIVILAEMETLLNKIQVEIEVENNLNIVEKGL